MLLFLTTNMAAVTSFANQQLVMSNHQRLLEFLCQSTNSVNLFLTLLNL